MTQTMAVGPNNDIYVRKWRRRFVRTQTLAKGPQTMATNHGGRSMGTKKPFNEGSNNLQLLSLGSNKIFQPVKITLRIREK